MPPVELPDLLVQQLDERVIVLAHDLGEDVEGARAEHDVADLRHLRELVRDDPGVTRDADAEHRLSAETEPHGIGHGDDLHHPGVRELLHPLADGGLAEADGLPDLGVRAAAIDLQLLDDGLRRRVEHQFAPFAAHATDSDSRNAKRQRIPKNRRNLTA